MALSGRLRSAVIIGMQGIRARKLRTLLSMVSLFLGVLAVVTVQAGSEIADRALLADIELAQGKDGTVVFNVPPNAQTVPVTLESVRDRPDAVAATRSNAIIGEPGVSPVNPGASPLEYANRGGYGPGPGAMICDPSGCRVLAKDDSPAPPGQAVEMQLIGLTGDIRPFRPLHAEAGRWLDFTGEPSLSPGLVLNKEAAKGLTQFRVPAEMRIPGAVANPTPRVLGVVNDGESQPTAYLRADELLNWMPQQGADDVQAAVSMTIYLAPTARDVEQTIRARMVANDVPADQMFSYTVDVKKHMRSQLDLMRAIFLAMAALVLLIGVAGILNVGLATVGERIEEFALRRAVGTPRLLLAGIVLSETLIIGMLTAAAAIGVGVAGLAVASRVLSSRFQMLEGVAFPWQAGVAGVIAGLVAGVLGGLLPAIRAARIPIATVMRA